MFNELPGDREAMDAMHRATGQPLQHYVYADSVDGYHYVRQGGVNVAGPFTLSSVAYSEAYRLNRNQIK